MNLKAQVSLEMSIAVGITMLVFLSIGLIANQHRANLQGIDSEWKKENVCQELSDVISNVYASGPGTKWNGSIDNYAVRIDSKGQIEITESQNIDVNRFGDIAYYINCGPEEDAFLYRSLKTRTDLNIYLYRTAGGQQLCMNNTNGAIGDIQQLMNAINNYDVVIFEDAHMNKNYLATMENFTFNGGKLIVSEHIFNKNDVNTLFPIFGGATYIKDATYYYAKVVQPNPDFNLRIEDKIRVADNGAIIPPNQADVIATFCTSSNCNTLVPTRHAIAQWKYGLGKVSYFSDFDTTFQGARSGESFTDVAIEFIKQYSIVSLTNVTSNTCNYSGIVVEPLTFTGKITVENIDGRIVLSNA